MEQYKNELIEVGKLLYQKNYTTGTEGNLSIRISREEILTTRSGVCKGNMSSDDLVLVNRVAHMINKTDRR
ncbi:MAG: class II aldolase/adducin family protein [Calditrichia bacterium]